MEQLVHSRKFEVEYYEQDEHHWRVVSHLNDDAHDIRATVEVAVPERVVQAARAEFVRYPREECPAVAAKMQALVGANLLGEFSDRMRQLFYGAEGCPNVMNLLSTSTPGLIYFYYPDQMKKDAMKPQEWQARVATRLANDCLAHKLMLQKYAAGRPPLSGNQGA